MTLKPISRDSADWRNLKLWLDVEIRRLQRQLEDANPAIPPSTHDVTRGRIAAFRSLINEVEPTPLLEAEKVEEQPLDTKSGY
jgi:hypothetical protein